MSTDTDRKKGRALPDVSEEILKAIEEEIATLNKWEEAAPDVPSKIACVEARARLKAYVAALIVEADIKVVSAVRSMVAMDSARARAGAGIGKLLGGMAPTRKDNDQPAKASEGESEIGEGPQD